MHDARVRCELVGGLTNTEVKTECWKRQLKCFRMFRRRATSEQGAAMSFKTAPGYLRTSAIFLLIEFFSFRLSGISTCDAIDALLVTPLLLRYLMFWRSKEAINSALINAPFRNHSHFRNTIVGHDWTSSIVSQTDGLDNAICLDFDCKSFPQIIREQNSRAERRFTWKCDGLGSIVSFVTKSHGN